MDPITIGIGILLSLAGTGLSIWGQSKANRAAQEAGNASLAAKAAQNRADRLRNDAQYLSALQQADLDRALAAKTTADAAHKRAVLVQNALFGMTAVLLICTAVVLATRAAKVSDQ